MSEKQQSNPIYKADYKEATPEQVAKSLLTYRPKAQKPTEKKRK